MNTETSVFKDIRLRRAVHLALDRQAMIDLISEGEGHITPLVPISYSQYVPEEYWLQKPGWNPKTKAADIAEAKRLVAEATGGKGLDLPLLWWSPPQQAWVLLAPQHLAEVGIRATPTRVSAAVAQQRIDAGDYSFTISSWSVPYVDPAAFIDRGYLPTSAQNWTRWTNQEFTDLYQRQGSAVDVAERGKLLRQMTDIFEREVPAAGMTENYLVVGVSRKVKGLTVLPPAVMVDLRYDGLWMEP